ncbi:MAG: hypothetical protein P8Y97_09365, partial [Candidatus Lokiarchaeota archaeon]
MGFIATIIINMLASLLPLGYGNTGELSDAIPNLFVPIGLTFSIWGAIYFLLALFIIYQARDIFKKDDEKIEMPFQDKISFFFILSSIANITWIFLWHYKEIFWSLIAMLVLLISLLIIYLKLNIGKANVSKYEKIFVHLPFSVYLGWITVATIANVTAVLVTFGVESFGLIAEIWTIIVIGVAVLITLLMLFIRKDIAYSAVVIWATLGIFLKQLTGDLIISITALIVVILLTIVTLFILYKEYL